METTFTQVVKEIEEGKTAIGIEFGTTRIKAVMVDSNCKPVASGDFEWENHLIDGYWTYSVEEIWNGIQEAFVALINDTREKYNVELKTAGCIGISGMMHGYMPFDSEEKLLVPFRTWRNSNAHKAAEILTEKFQCNVPDRWSIAHLYQAVLDNEEHVPEIRTINTLAGYVHQKLGGNRVVGIGEGSGILPTDPESKDYHPEYVKIFEEIIKNEYPDFENLYDLKAVLPGIKLAGEDAGMLSEEGAKLLDPSGQFQPGVPLCPPEGDAETGMIAANAITPRTGNVSLGTSAMAIIVLESAFEKLHREIDIVATPLGNNVAMVHGSNCSSDLNHWVNLLAEYSEIMGTPVDKSEIFGRMFKAALDSDKDCGGLINYGFLSSEFIADCDAGRPLFVRKENAKFDIGNFFRAQIYSSFAILGMGVRILKEEEHVEIDYLAGHGGIFKTPVVAQKLVAGALETPIAISKETAGEGGAWGIAVLAQFRKQGKETGMDLYQYMDEVAFKDVAEPETANPDKEDTAGFKAWLKDFEAGLASERAAIETL